MRNMNLLPKFSSLISCLFIWSFIGAQTIDFNYFSSKDGLLQASIICSLEDSRGYLWFGTLDGLNRYDGYDFTIFKTDANNNQSIIDNFITVLHEDAHGNIINLWRTTFLVFLHLSLDRGSLSQRCLPTDQFSRRVLPNYQARC